MPTKLRLEEASAERASVQFLLSQAQQTGDAIGRRQFERRLRELDDELRVLGNIDEKLASAALFFSGPKVIGSRGIEADFAGDTLEKFQDLVSKRFARRELGLPGARGPVAARGDSKLMVTGVTRGSFGFVLEEVNDQQQITRTQLHEVVSDVVDLIAQISDPIEEVFLEAVADIDSRSLGATRALFSTLSSAQASMRIVEGAREISLGRDEIQRAKERTEGLEVSERDNIQMSGLLYGLLPAHRRFEFVVDETGENFSGRVAADVSRAMGDQLLGGLFNPVGKRWVAEFELREVTRPGRPVRRFYTLLRLINEL
jgi:hypothetical protein